MKAVVLVPGIMGSRLQDDQGRVWPPTMREVIFGYDKIDRLIGNDVVATDVIQNVGLVGVYSSLIKDLKRCGYSEGSDEKRLIEFPYDWRKSNQTSAAALADRLDAEFDDATDFDELDITLLVHSMGGLVSRFLLETGQFNGRSWFGSISKLVTMGTPHRGAPAAIRQLGGDKGKLGMSAADVKKLADDPRYPSLYELAGPPQNGFATIRERRGGVPTVIDPLGAEIEAALSLSAANIAAANGFWATLSAGTQPGGVDYFCVVGSAFKTIVRSEFILQNNPPAAVEKRTSGDETVPILSASLPGIAHMFSRKKHGSIFEDRSVRETLYRVLDAPANVRPQAADDVADVGAAGKIGISTNAEVYDVGEPIEISVHYVDAQDDPSESFQIIEIDPDTEAPKDGANPISISAEFGGSSIESFSFSVSNDLHPGVFLLKPLSETDDPLPAYFYVKTADSTND